MAAREFQVTFDCAAPSTVASFWSAVLEYEMDVRSDEDWAAATDPAGTGPRLYFQKVPEGKTVKNRLHLDVRVGAGLVGAERLTVLEAECARLVQLGATRVRLLPADTENESCMVMQDVEGNEFCLD
jgi:hypothetical protein